MSGWLFWLSRKNSHAPCSRPDHLAFFRPPPIAEADPFLAPIGGGVARGGAGRLQQERGPGRSGTGWRRCTAAGRSGCGDGDARRCGSDHRAAWPSGSLPSSPGTGARCGHPARTPVPRGQRGQGRPGIVPHRLSPLCRGIAKCAGRVGESRGKPCDGPGTGRSLQAFDRRERHQPAGIRQCRGCGQGGRG